MNLHTLLSRFQNGWQRRRWLLILLLLQGVVIALTFADMWREPGQHMFCNYHDGMRQYYFFQAYVEQEPGQSWLKVEEVGYPYGEYLLYTDGTPLLAFLTRLVSTYLVDLDDRAIDVYNGFILLGRLLSTYLLYLILTCLGIKPWRVLLFALVLPWINGEFIKLSNGHLNLSYSWPYLLAIYAGLRMYQAHEVEARAYHWAIGFAVAISLTAFLHLYWLPLTTIPLGFLLLAYLAHLWRQRRDVLPVIGYGLTATLSPWLVVLLLVRLTDGYFSARAVGGEGYDWERWVFELSGYHSAYDWHSVRFFFEDRVHISYGWQVYLGNFALFFAVVLLLLYWLRRPYSVSVRQLMYKDRQGSFFRFFMMGALVSLLISLGENIKIWDDTYVVHNYLNLFFYLRKLVSERITQFRDVSRFAYIGWWWFNLLAVFLFDRWLKGQMAIWIRVLSAFLLLLLVLDGKDMLRQAHKHWVRPNLLYRTDRSDIDELIQGVDLSPYQGALPIPYFHEGAGENRYAVDGFDDMITHTFQLQRWGELPLLTSKFARGNRDHALQLLSLLQGDSTGVGISPELLAQLDERPVLILYDENFYNGQRELTGNQLQPAWDLLQNAHRIIERYDMQEIERYGHFRLYRWEIAEVRARVLEEK